MASRCSKCVCRCCVLRCVSRLDWGTRAVHLHTMLARLFQFLSAVRAQPWAHPVSFSVPTCCFRLCHGIYVFVQLVKHFVWKSIIPLSLTKSTLNWLLLRELSRFELVEWIKQFLILLFGGLVKIAVRLNVRLNSLPSGHQQSQAFDDLYWVDRPSLQDCDQSSLLRDSWLFPAASWLVQCDRLPFELSLWLIHSRIRVVRSENC